MHIVDNIIDQSFDKIEPALTPLSRLFGHNARYIKLDGRKYGAKNITDFTETIDFRIASLFTVALLGPEVFKHGLSSFNLSSGLAMGLTSFLICASEFYKLDDNSPTIDRDGNIKNGIAATKKMIDILKLERYKGMAFTSFCVATGIIAKTKGINIPFEIQKPELFFIPLATIMSRSISHAYRHQMLLRGHTSDKNGYVFVDDNIENSKEEKNTDLSYTSANLQF